MTNLGGHDLETRARGLPRRRGRPAALLHRLHDQGLRPAVRRPQGQPRRADDAGPDGDLQARAPDRRTARSGTASPASRSRPRSSRRSARRCRSRRGPRPMRAPPRRRAGDPAGRPARGARRRPRRRSAGSWASSRATTASSRPASSRPRPTSRCRPISAPGSRAAACSTAPSTPTSSSAQQVASSQLWAESRRGQHVELGIAENNLFLMLAALGLAGPAVRRAPAAGRHALRPVHRPRPRCADLRELPGRALPAGGDAVRHHAGARGRRAPVGRDQPDRHRPARPARLRARLCRRARGDHALRLRAPAGRGRRARSISGSRPGRSRSPSAR